VSPTKSTLLLGALALAFASAAQDRGKLLGIKAGGDAKASAVLIFADRPLSFTTMKLAGPPRVVVDFADTDIASARRELTVEDGTVRRVAMAPAGSRTARVVVELEADADFDVRTVRNEVELRIARPSALASAERSGSPAPQAAAPKPPDQAAAAPKPPDQAAAAPKPPEQAAAAPKPPEQAGAGPRIPEQPATAPGQAQPAAEAPKQAEAAAKPPAQVESPPKQPAAEPPPPLPGTASSSPSQPARTSPPPAATEKPPRAVPPPAPASKPETQTRTGTEPRTSPAEAAKIASLPKVSLVGSAPEGPSPAAKSPPPKAHANITGVGFRPVGAGEVIVRGDHPLTCDVSAEGTAVLLHLPGARIPLPNNRRPLDTRFFDGAVQRIVPLSVAGGTDVRIELRQPAEYKLEQSGSVVTVTFSSPR
jgi:AMIN domain-containing protein